MLKVKIKNIYSLMLILTLFFLISCSSLNHQYKFELENQSIINGWKQISQEQVRGEDYIYRTKDLKLFFDVFVTSRKLTIGPSYLPILPVQNTMIFYSDIYDRFRIVLGSNLILNSYDDFIKIYVNDKNINHISETENIKIDEMYYYFYEIKCDLSYVNNIKIEFNNNIISDKNIHIPSLFFKNTSKIVYEEFSMH